MVSRSTLEQVGGRVVASAARCSSLHSSSARGRRHCVGVDETILLSIVEDPSREREEGGRHRGERKSDERVEKKEVEVEEEGGAEGEE